MGLNKGFLRYGIKKKCQTPGCGLFGTCEPYFQGALKNIKDF